jgi:hypothetical protein
VRHALHEFVAVKPKTIDNPPGEQRYCLQHVSPPAYAISPAIPATLIKLKMFVELSKERRKDVVPVSLAEF